MSDKPKIVLLSYDPETRTIEVEERVPGRKPSRGVKEGMTVKEFKKFVREKFGNKVDIVNEIKSKREVFGFEEKDDGRKEVDDRFDPRDIREAMLNREKWKQH